MNPRGWDPLYVIVLLIFLLILIWLIAPGIR